MAPQDQMRGQQMDLAGMFRNMAMGNGPSLAQGILQEGLGQSQRDAMSMGLGAQQRGMNVGSAMRAAMRARQQAAANAMNQAAQLRSAEQMGAMGQLGNVLGGMRGMDIGLAQQQAANNMGVAGQNAGNALGLAGQNAQNALTQQQLQATINQNAAGNLQRLIGGIGQAVASVAMPTPAKAFSGGQVAHHAMGGGNVDPGGARTDFGPRGTIAMDSPQRDTVPAMLSPGEIVLPRSVAMAEDSPERAKAFVEAIRRSRKKVA